MNVDLARIQFAFTSINHFFFVPVTIGLAFLTALLQTAWYRSKKDEYLRLTRFFGTLLVINVAIGVGVHRDHGHHRILHRVDLHRPVPIRDGLHHPRPQQPHRLQHRVRALRAQGDDRRRRLAAGGAPLPGLDLLRLPPPRQPVRIRARAAAEHTAWPPPGSNN